MAELRTYQPSFTAGELSPALGARVDLAKYATGLRTAINLFIHPHGGASNRAGTEFINEVKASANNARLIPFQFNTEQSYILEFGQAYIRFYRDGGVILGGVPYEVGTFYLHTEVDDIVYIQEADVMYLCHPEHPVLKLSRLADNNWVLAVVTFAPSTVAPGGLAVSALVGSGATSYSYVVAAVDGETGEESLPTPPVTVSNDLTINGNKNRISWSAVAGAGRYIVYKHDNGVYGYIGGTQGLFFDDDNIVADLADTPQTGRNPFVGAGNYPRCGTFVEQRLALASTKNDPQAIWLSQSANYENFGYSQPSKASERCNIQDQGPAGQRGAIHARSQRPHGPEFGRGMDCIGRLELRRHHAFGHQDRQPGLSRLRQGAADRCGKHGAVRAAKWWCRPRLLLSVLRCLCGQGFDHPGAASVREPDDQGMGIRSSALLDRLGGLGRWFAGVVDLSERARRLGLDAPPKRTER
ncbi:hypothetical protein [Bradyrhizobium cenepequi]